MRYVVVDAPLLVLVAGESVAVEIVVAVRIVTGEELVLEDCCAEDLRFFLGGFVSFVRGGEGGLTYLFAPSMWLSPMYVLVSDIVTGVRLMGWSGGMLWVE